MEKINNKDQSQDPLIFLGFAEKPSQKDFHYDKFPSKIGGSPVMLFPVEDQRLFLCEHCGGKMTFLMQVYCFIEEIPHCYHRTLYLFFCYKCYRFYNSFKCLRLQLSKKNEFYNDLKPKDLKLLGSKPPDLNTICILQPEKKLVQEDEIEKNIDLYVKYAETLYVKGLDEGDELDDLEYDPVLSYKDKQLLSKMMGEYMKNNVEVEGDDKIEDQVEDEFLTNIEKRNKFSLESDVYFKFFYNMTKEFPDQVLRYSRNIAHPIWFCKNIPKNKFECKHCKKKKIPELQIMPEVFNMYEPLMNHDIGTIVIYSCDCDITLSEEHVFVQRTGEKILDLDKIKDDVKFKGMLIDTSTIKKKLN